MIYRKVQEQNPSMTETGDNAVFYAVYEGKDPAAELSYHIQPVRGEAPCRFWIDEVRLRDPYAEGSTMDAILLFLQYKCKAAGCPAMYVRVKDRNLFYLDLYRQFGFYRIDREESSLPHGKNGGIEVLRFPLPASKDEDFIGYILRSGREKHSAQPIQTGEVNRT